MTQSNGKVLSAETLFKTIQEAQNRGAFVKYSKALQEIRNGQKNSHWIWYVWPTLKVLRLGTDRPHFLMHNFATAQQYLTTDPLASRLEEVSTAALEHLQAGKPLLKLMGSRTDAQKVYESLTVFAVAAAVSTHPEASRQLDLFCTCLEAVQSRELEALAKPSPKAKAATPTDCPQKDNEVAGTPLDLQALQAILKDASAQDFDCLRSAVSTTALRTLRRQLCEANGLEENTHLEVAAEPADEQSGDGIKSRDERVPLTP